MAQCLTPFMAKDKNKDEIPVPCGKCPNCYARRASAWSFRLMQEEKISISAHFITLTYDTQNVPITLKGRMSLHRRHVQLFFKRLRKITPSNKITPIKYYSVGEYGGKTHRPHYHILLFNADITKLQEAWNLGSIHYGTVTSAAIGYCLKYISKPCRIPQYNGDDREPEKALMSKGLGAAYLSTSMKNWHLNDLGGRMYCNIEDGKKITMPRYYKDKIYDEQQRDLASNLQREQIQKKLTQPETAEESALRARRIVAAFNRQKISYNKNRKL